MRLARLEIEDFALIANASLDFAAGFTVCTGETGSGKTMLLGALAFVLGERSSADIVRRGAARARVTLALEPDAAFLQRLSEDGFEAEPDEPATFVREMLENGKSSARVNGRLATSAQLRTLGALVLDRVGQHEQQKLLSRAYQLDVLDAFAGEAALVRRSAVAAAYERAVRLEAEAREFERDDGRALAELEFARFAAHDIEAVNPQQDEDDVLRERREYLANGERIAAALARAHAALTESDNSALESLGTAAASVQAVARYAPALAELAAALGALQSETSEAAVAITREAEAADFDPAELETVTARLDALERLKKKYGGSIAKVLE
ncbi:MAG: AAA family ATPase, partial [Candidatus Eremiobacteraeota bacterium]|nr:AAA family ATPase [Candidatus Eremiobacteraeota bacterium]